MSSPAKAVKPPKKLTQRKSGEWVQPRMKSYFLQCCDCNLIHRLNFRVVIGKDGIAKVQFQAFRANRSQKKERLPK